MTQAIAICSRPQHRRRSAQIAASRACAKSGQAAIALAFIAIFGSACRRIEPVDVAATRESCGLDQSAIWPVVADYAGVSNVELSARCVEALSADFGLEWSAEAGSPRHLQRYNWDDDPFEVLVSFALYAILTAPGPSAGSELAQAGMPPTLRDALSEVQSINGFPDDVPAAWLYYGLAAGRTSRLRLDHDPSWTDNIGEYSPATKTLTLADHRNHSPVELAGTIVHEIGHTWQWGHVDCPATSTDLPESGCDRTDDGPNGFEAWFLFRAGEFGACAGDDLGAVYCRHAAQSADAACRRIYSGDRAVSCAALSPTSSSKLSSCLQSLQTPPQALVAELCE